MIPQYVLHLLVIFQGCMRQIFNDFSDIEIMPWNCHSFSDQLSTTICRKPYIGMRNQEGGPIPVRKNRPQSIDARGQKTLAQSG